jgi:hypothetical protein
LRLKAVVGREEKCYHRVMRIKAALKDNQEKEIIIVDVETPFEIQIGAIKNSQSIQH